MSRGGFLGLSQGNVGDGDPRSFSHIAFCDRSPDAARAAGDQSDFVLELHRGVVASAQAWPDR
jgi:hypothetical protein